MKTRIIVALAFAGLGSSGCASIIKGGDQTIAISTPPTTGAVCTLSSVEGNWQVVSPGAVTVERSKEDVQIRCSKTGWQSGYGVIPSNFDGWTVGNILIGGIIGVGIDAATGAINDYPHSFQVPMVQVVADTGPGSPAAPERHGIVRPAFP